ncbi:beta-hydroxyacyl-ACP dehydratase [Cupriavidus sp. GA3-3]|uniref:ApeP family dehydratase n=1 Tax=Cupriavidus TaxID=106589 RepID=UPI0003304984|nr:MULTISPECIES: hotdog family protein [Cupriavidus]EON20109.1 beta-hydroxyacyl-ACP dehydratase [Cupriavidus sp. GA3-3]
MQDLDTLPPIAEVVPHGGAMLLLDALVHADDEGCTARATVQPAQLFTNAAGMPGWVGIEYMAQAIAAWAGMRDRRAGRAPGIGFLLGSRRYECDVPAFPIGSELTISVRAELIGDNGLGQFACRLALDGREVARANVSVFQPADAQAFLQGQQP